jgi:serine/threonine protein kinase
MLSLPVCQILEMIGQGGVEVVYKARDSHLDRFVAITILPAEKVSDPSVSARSCKKPGQRQP